MISTDAQEEPFLISAEMELAWLQLSKWLFGLAVIGMFAVVATLFYYLVSFVTYFRLELDSVMLPGIHSSTLVGIASVLGLFATVGGMIGNIYLFKFSRKIKAAIWLKEQSEFESAWLYLKKHYRITGALMIAHWLFIAIMISVGSYFFRL